MARCSWMSAALSQRRQITFWAVRAFSTPSLTSFSCSSMVDYDHIVSAIAARPEHELCSTAHTSKMTDHSQRDRLSGWSRRPNGKDSFGRSEAERQSYQWLNEPGEFARALRFAFL